MGLFGGVFGASAKLGCFEALAGSACLNVEGSVIKSPAPVMYGSFSGGVMRGVPEVDNPEGKTS